MLVLLIRASCQPAKPSCREDIISWFHEVEMKRSAGVNPSTGKMAKWFHGESTYDIVVFLSAMLARTTLRLREMSDPETTRLCQRTVPQG